jgi:hypothetical protein
MAESVAACWLLRYFCALFAGEPGRLIRDRYRTASQVIQNQVRRCLQLLGLRFEHFMFKFLFLNSERERVFLFCKLAKFNHRSQSSAYMGV